MWTAWGSTNSDGTLSELVRRVEAGEEITITEDGRPRARLVPVGPVRWVRWDDIDGLFRRPADPTWEQDRDLLDDRS